MKVKTGDTVRIMAGKDKGKEGKVLQVFPKLGRVVVENLNMMTRHLRRRTTDGQGQKIRFPSPVNISNLKVISPKSGKPGRVGYKIVEKDGLKKKIRVLKTRDGSEDID